MSEYGVDGQFHPRFTKQFERIIESWKKRDRELVKALKGGVDKVLVYPFRSDGWATGGEFRGKRKVRVGRGYRIVFLACAECRQTKRTAVNACEFCSETDNATVVFFFGGRKKERHGDYRM